MISLKRIFLRGLSTLMLPLPALPQSQTDSDAELKWAHRVQVSRQFNSITQFHPSIHSPYAGDNSIQPRAEWASSRVMTLFTGFRLTRSTDIRVDFESAGGGGISSA